MIIPKSVTILGFGSLLSERSAKTTFPNLQNFRLGKVHNYKRVFGHPASIFFRRGIANIETKEMSSLSTEYCEGSSFVCSVFEVSNENGEFSNGNLADFSPSMAFREREEEFEIIMVPYEELSSNVVSDVDSDHSSPSNLFKGILCTRSTDEKYIELWGDKRFEENYLKYNINTIWDWGVDSGLKPCGPYLRHCVLAAKNMGDECYQSFLDDTFLVDSTTTIREYIENNPVVMDTLPPPDLRERYGG